MINENINLFSKLEVIDSMRYFRDNQSELQEDLKKRVQKYKQINLDAEREANFVKTSMILQTILKKGLTSKMNSNVSESKINDFETK